MLKIDTLRWYHIFCFKTCVKHVDAFGDIEKNVKKSYHESVLKVTTTFSLATATNFAYTHHVVPKRTTGVPTLGRGSRYLIFV